MKIIVTWRDKNMPKLDIQRAGMVIQEGFLAVYPNVDSGDCTMYPADLIEMVEVITEEGEQKVVPIRGRH